MTPDDLQLVTSLVEQRLEEGASERDIARVTAQLGRYPRGMVAVGARCVCGNPLAVVTRPLLPGNIPFPTTCYLTSPEAVKAVSHVEASGDMASYTSMIEQDEQVRQAYERAHDLYLAFRHALAQRLGDSEEHLANISAGGMPVRVKCLHALVAQSLVMGRGVNPISDMVLDRVRGEFDPQVCRCGRLDIEDGGDAADTRN